jgi:hypothetical protein
MDNHLLAPPLHLWSDLRQDMVNPALHTWMRQQQDRESDSSRHVTVRLALWYLHLEALTQVCYRNVA